MSLRPWTLVLRGIVTDRRGRYLLLQRSSRSRSWPSFWEFPGGKVDPGEDIFTAMVRELKEETALTAGALDFVTAFSWERRHDRILYVLFRVKTYSGKFGISAEHDDHGWFTKKELKSLNVSPPLKGVREDLCGS